jgi:hypothetical protein
MAIAYDAKSSSGIQSNAASYSWQHVCTGSDLVLIVHVSIDESGGASEYVDSITWNTSETFTKVAHAVDGTSRRSEIWYLEDPTPGTYNIEVTNSEAISNCGASAVSLTGCDTLDTSSTLDTQAKSSSPSHNLTPVASNCWIVDGLVHDARATAGTVTGDQTAEFGDFDNGGSRCLSSYGGPFSAQATYTWTTGYDSWCTVLASFKPPAAVGGHAGPLVNAPRLHSKVGGGLV